jgi:Myb-like DNA-binding domain
MASSSRIEVRAGDSASLWNGTCSPGWTKEEANILRLAIMKFGFGAWKEIEAANCLPGKTPAQLNIQAQRMIGQQSIAEFYGVRLDTIRVYEVNEMRTGVKRKNGLIINTGSNPSNDELARRRLANIELYGLAQRESDDIVLPDRSDEALRMEQAARYRALCERLVYLEQLIKLKTTTTTATSTSSSSSSSLSSVAKKPRIN